MGSCSLSSNGIRHEKENMVYPHERLPWASEICAYSNKSLIYLSILRFLLYCLLLICSPFVSAVSAPLSPTPLLCPSHSALSLSAVLHLMMHCQKVKNRVF